MQPPQRMRAELNTPERPRSASDSGKSITHHNFSQYNLLPPDRAGTDRTIIHCVGCLKSNSMALNKPTGGEMS
jgi:hypothetical protein